MNDPTLPQKKKYPMGGRKITFFGTETEIGWLNESIRYSLWAWFIFDMWK